MRIGFAPLSLVALFAVAIPVRADDAPRPLTRIALGSCIQQARPQPIWDAVLAAEPEVFVFLGDNIYGDTQKMRVLKEKYAQLGAVPGFAKLRESCSVLATWDDHDYGENDAGREYPKRAESQKIFLDFWQEPADAPRRTRDGIYDARTFGPEGKRVQFILLDTRSFRDLLKRKEKRAKGAGPYELNPDPATTLLGEDQWAWLEQQLRQPAEVRIICSSIQVISDEHGWEKWDNFPHERDRLIALLNETKAQGAIFISGDRHFAELSKLEPAEEVAPYVLYDLTSSSLNQAMKEDSHIEPNPHRVGEVHRPVNFGMILIDWEPRDPVLRLQIRNERGEPVIDRPVKLSELR